MIRWTHDLPELAEGGDYLDDHGDFGSDKSGRLERRFVFVFVPNPLEDGLYRVRPAKAVASLFPIAREETRYMAPTPYKHPRPQELVSIWLM